jgi:hypothetical protein
MPHLHSDDNDDYFWVWEEENNLICDCWGDNEPDPRPVETLTVIGDLL